MIQGGEARWRDGAAGLWFSGARRFLLTGRVSESTRECGGEGFQLYTHDGDAS